MHNMTGEIHDVLFLNCISSFVYFLIFSREFFSSGQFTLVFLWQNSKAKYNSSYNLSTRGNLNIVLKE